MSPETKGEKQIVLEIKRMTEAAKTLKERAETENLSEHMQERVENAIEESESYGWMLCLRKRIEIG